MQNNSAILNKKLGISPTKNQIKIFEEYVKIFLEKNSVINLISKSNESVLFEKHIFDSLAINLFFRKFGLQSDLRLLDIGTGGGFPSVPVSIMYDNIEVYPLDSINKKINAIVSIKDSLGLKNLYPICARVEDFQRRNDFEKFDIVTTRAVAQMDVILKYAMPLLKNNAYFVAYKSKTAQNELKEAEQTLRFFKAKVVDIIEYTLPLDEIHERCLIVIQKLK